MDNDKPRYGLPVDFAVPPDLVALAEEARDLGVAAAATRSRREHSWICGFDREFSKELGRRGWLGMTWPQELGGQGRSNFERFLVAEALIAAGAPIAATWVGDRQIGPTLVAHGSPEQQRRYLPAMIDGSVTWCIGMSEPDAGSDLAGVRTRAIPDGADYVIEGRKIWTSFAAEAHFCYLIAARVRAVAATTVSPNLSSTWRAPACRSIPSPTVPAMRTFARWSSTRCGSPLPTWWGRLTGAGPSSWASSNTSGRASTG